MTNEGKRLQWPDMCKGIAMILTILWHMEYTIPNIRGFYAPFFMPVFFFIAGYFQKNGSFLTFLKKRCINLIIPFFILSIATCILHSNVLLGINSNGSLLDYIIGVILQVSGEKDTMWFVPCLFVSQIIAFAIIRFNRSKKIIIISTVLFSIGCVYDCFINIHLPWHIEIALVMQMFVVAGWCCKKHSATFDKIISNKYTLFVGTPSYALAVVADKIFLQSSYDVHMGAFGHYFDFLVLSVWGGVMLISFSRIIPRISVIEFIGKNTLYFYAFQYTGIYLAGMFINYCGVSNFFDNSYVMNSVLMVPVLTFVIAFCAIISITINGCKSVVSKEKCRISWRG